MSQNICTLVDLFDKAVAEGARPNTENEVGTLRRDIEIYPDSQIARHPSSYIYRHPATIASLSSEGLLGPAYQLKLSTEIYSGCNKKQFSAC